MTEYSDYFAPRGLRVRGTVVVVPGRGETRATYGRLGRRLAVDAYRVRVLDAPVLDADDTAALTEFGVRIAAAVEDTAPDDAAGDDGVVRPLVVVGADDTLTPPDRAAEMAASIPAARQVVVPTCGHLSTLEQPEPVTRTLVEFLHEG